MSEFDPGTEIDPAFKDFLVAEAVSAKPVSNQEIP
jgi:hypothetical protein